MAHQRSSGTNTAAPEPGADGEAVKDVLGRNIGSLRVQRGLAVRDLAQQSGVSSAFISQIEHGAATPSVPTLLRIAQALRVHIGDLFNAEPSSSTVVSVAQRNAYEYPERGIIEAQVSTDPSARLEVLWIKLAPGGGTGPEPFTHGADVEFVYVITGTVAITVGTQVHQLNAGDGLTFAGHELHGSQNLSEEPSELLWVQTPASY